jgi:hypothetical protein
MRVALMADQREFADADIGLSPRHTMLVRQPHQALTCAMQQLGIGWEGERWPAKFGQRYKWKSLPERGTFGVNQERE